MSIIYDALRKIQQKRSGKFDKTEIHTTLTDVNAAPKLTYKPAKPQASVRSNLAVKAVKRIAVTGKAGIWMVLLSAVLFTGLFSGYTRYSAYIHQRHMQTRLVLNGVFTTDGMKVAMINNESYQVGDKIGDIKVASIGQDSVKLKHQDSNIDLHMTA